MQVLSSGDLFEEKHFQRKSRWQFMLEESVIVTRRRILQNELGVDVKASCLRIGFMEEIHQPDEGVPFFRLLGIEKPVDKADLLRSPQKLLGSTDKGFGSSLDAILTLWNEQRVFPEEIPRGDHGSPTLGIGTCDDGIERWVLVFGILDPQSMASAVSAA